MLEFLVESNPLVRPYEKFALVLNLDKCDCDFTTPKAGTGMYFATEEKSQKDQVVTASKPSKPLLT